MEFTKFENIYKEDQLDKLQEAYDYQLNETEEKALQIFETYYEEGVIKDEDVLDWLENPSNEGIVGSIFGGLTGFALGKKLGKIIAKVLGIKKGILYDLLTSRIFGAAIGSSIGKQF